MARDNAYTTVLVCATTVVKVTFR